MGLAAAAPLWPRRAWTPCATASRSPAPRRWRAKAASNVGDKVDDTLKETVSSKVDEAGGAGGLVKEAASGLLPFGGGGDDGGGKGGVAGRRQGPADAGAAGGRRGGADRDRLQPVHAVRGLVDVHAPRHERQQDDPLHGQFSTKIWTQDEEFTAKIETQRPDERIKWRVSQGITHTGVVTFHELAPRLTRIELNFDVDPGGMIEKAARGMRHVKRAARADLHRFKAFIEMAEQRPARGAASSRTASWSRTTTRPTTRSASTPTSRTSSRRTSPRTRTRRGVRGGRPTRTTAAVASAPSDELARPRPSDARRDVERDEQRAGSRVRGERPRPIERRRRQSRGSSGAQSPAVACGRGKAKAASQRAARRKRKQPQLTRDVGSARRAQSPNVSGVTSHQ